MDCESMIGTVSILGMWMQCSMPDIPQITQERWKRMGKIIIDGNYTKSAWISDEAYLSQTMR